MQIKQITHMTWNPNGNAFERRFSRPVAVEQDYTVDIKRASDAALEAALEMAIGSDAVEIAFERCHRIYAHCGAHLWQGSEEARAILAAAGRRPFERRTLERLAHDEKLLADIGDRPEPDREAWPGPAKWERWRDAVEMLAEVRRELALRGSR